SQKQEIYSYRFNPGISIPPEASLIHGIYDEDVVTCPPFSEKAHEIYDLLDDADLAGFNSNKFDLPLLLEEFIRAGLSFCIDNRFLIDIHKIYLLYEKRNLENAYKFYCGKTLDNAHNAEADTRATYEVLLGQLKRYSDLPNDVAQLHYISNEERFIDSGRRFIDDNGVAIFNFGKYKGRTVEEVLKIDPGYYSWIMNGEFAMHTKQKLMELKQKLKFKQSQKE
ncbi:MAG: exonuclease domain-containing protein, partial [Chitinophagales bacterium]|nr:exonuclease domain-containing protein [Chitinophagales bacterium]